MIRFAHDSVPDPREDDILRVLEDVVSRRVAGESILDEHVLAAHPHLLPELEERLRSLSAVESARQMVEDSFPTKPYSPDARPPGETPSLHGYELVDLIGRGAMGVVYRAVQRATGREVAVKFMHLGPFGGSHDQARFEREARVLAQLRHPNIVTVYDTGWSHGRFYLVMDYVDSESLDAHVRNRRLPLRERLELFAAICDAAHAAHLRGVIHRDLKPGNIRVDAEGQPHLLDFGLAKLAPDLADTADPESFASSMTMTGQFIGSLPWASPEQAQGLPDAVDLRTDVYSLGVILYQLLTDRFPYRVVGNLRDVIDRILTADPERPSSINPAIDDEVQTIVLKALAKEPVRRYQSAGDLALDVRRYLRGEPIEAKRDSSWYVMKKALRRHRLAATVAAVMLLVSVTYAVTVSVLYRTARHEADRAQRTLAFLQDTLFQASSHRLGSDATLAEVLDFASGKLSGAFTDEPQIEAALRFTIGSAYETIWQKDKGIEQLRKALELSRASLGAEHPETLRIMVLLGMVLGEVGDPQSAELEREALAARRRIYGDRHRLVADSLSESAFTLFHAAEPPQPELAEQYYREAISIYEETIGPAHQDLARSLQAFGYMRSMQKHYEEAEELLRRALEMNRKLLGEDHQFTVEAMLSLADLMQATDRLAEAESMLLHVVEHAPRLFGRGSMPRMLRRLSWLQVAKADYAAAAESLRKALDLLCELTRQRHPQHVGELDSLRETLKGTISDEQYRAAVRTLFEAGAEMPQAIGSFVALARLRQAQENDGAALAIIEDALSVADARPGQGERFRPQLTALHAQALSRLNAPASSR